MEKQKNVKTATKKTKKYYPKWELFQVKKKHQIKDGQQIVSDIKEHTVVFTGGRITFKMDTEVPQSDLALMNDYQKEYYLNER